MGSGERQAAPEHGALGNPYLPSTEDALVEFLRSHVGCCVVMAAKGDLARALRASDWLRAERERIWWEGWAAGIDHAHELASDDNPYLPRPADRATPGGEE